MKYLSKILLICLILFLAIGFTLCAPPTTPDTVANKAIFDIPDSMTGGTSSGEVLPMNRAITQGTKDIVEDFFNYARHQIWWTRYWSQIVKLWIASIEAHGLFNLTANYEGEIESGDNAGDKVKWTVGPGDNEYTLEWWKKSGTDYNKFMEMHFDEYTKVDDVITVEGQVVLYIENNENITDPTGAKKPDRVKVIFDSDKDGKRYMRVELDEFLYTTDTDRLDPTYGTLGEQECIIIAEKDSSDIVTITGVNSGNGSKVLNYDGTPDDKGVPEERYYIYVGKGTSEKATLSLAIPKDDYTPSTVFDTFENTIGGIIREYCSDEQRWIADATKGNAYSGSVMEAMFLIEQGGLILDGDYSAGNINYTTETPSTTDFYNDLVTINNAYPDNEELENALYLMDVENPVYFQSGNYVDFGDTPPDSGYPAESELPSFDITKDTINNLVIEFLDTSNITNPGF